MSKLKKIIGHGGGGKSGGDGGRAPIEAPDSLRSIQLASVQDLLCEGEIEGLVDGLKSVYLDGTVVENNDGTFNFNNVQMQSVNGIQSQNYIDGFSGAEAETIVATQILNSASVTRTISDINISHVRVTLGFPQMTVQDVETGDINGTSVVIAIDIQNNGGGFVAQPLRNLFVTTNFIVAPISTTTIDATRFLIDVAWVGVSIQAPQSCEFKLQYKLTGDIDWIDFASHTFVDNTNYNSGLVVNLTANTNVQTGTKQFELTLPEDQYDFKVIKTNGSQQQEQLGSVGATLGFIYSPPLIGIEYGGSVSISIGKIWQPVYSDKISGKTTRRYKRAYKFALPDGGPWDVRVRRITADNSSSTLQNTTYFDSLAQIIDSKFAYPNSAIVGIKIDSKQFSSIPVRGYECYLSKVKVPSNYNPLTREYNGSWDGTFQVLWTDNPAWCFYDILIKNRYGLGDYITETDVDKWALYNIAQYCDTMVPNGFGGLEPRFTCNLYLQKREEAFKVIQNMASIFRAIAYWSHTTITASQDSPKNVTQIFSPANVIGGQFKYEGSSGRTRHNVVLAAWNDPQDGYLQKIEYVEDTESIARYGVNETEIVVTGCTSRGQAHRAGRALIFTEKEETETVVFRVGLGLILSSPGDIIETSDPIRSGIRFGGRVKEASLNTVTLDAPFEFLSSISYNISVMLPDGNIETKMVTTTAGSATLVNIDTPFTIIPKKWTMWIIASTELIAEKWRVVNMVEVNKTQMDITALSYREDKFAYIEENLVLEALPISLISASQPSAPIDLSVTESLYLSGLSVVAVKATLSWETVIGAVSYVMTYYQDEQNIVQVGDIVNNTIDIQPISEGNYTFNVYAVNLLGRRSQASSINVTINGKSTLPSTVSGFSITKVSGLAQAVWGAHPDLDVQVGGYIVIRHSSLTSSAAWQDGVILDSFTGLSVNGILPLISGTYMAKAVDSGGRYSEDIASFVATEGMITGFTTVGTLTEHATFTGVKTDIILESSELKLDGAMSGEYEFSAELDLSSVLTRRFEVDIKALSYDVGDLVDDRLDLIDTWSQIDGNSVDDCDATIYASITDDDPSGSPVWSPWVPFFVSDFTCRAIKFKMGLECETLDHNISVSELEVHAKIPV
jgi:predicted phage tail protein